MGRRTYGDRGDTSDQAARWKKKYEKLKVEYSRLRKELNRALNQLAEAGNAREEPPVKKPAPARCKQCGSYEFQHVNLMIRGVNKSYTRCAYCETDPAKAKL